MRLFLPGLLIMCEASCNRVIKPYKKTVLSFAPKPARLIRENIRMKKRFLFTLISATVITCLLLTGCANNSDVPFHAAGDEFLQPKSKPFSFSKPEHINWIVTNPDSVSPVYVNTFDKDKLTTKPFDVGGPELLKQPLEETTLNWKSLPEKPFDLKK